MIPILVTKVAEDSLEVLMPYMHELETPVGTLAVYKTNREGLTGKLYTLEGAFGDTITLRTKGSSRDYRFAL